MQNELEMEARLWDYIDGTAPEAERAAVAQLIADHAEWRSMYSELLEVHQLIDLTELEQPSMRFSKNVMEEISRHQIAPATKSYINNKIIWSIGWFFIIVIAGLLVYGFAQVDWSAGSSTGNPAGIDFTAVDYSAVFSNSFVNLFMMLNVVLGLMLLDRALSKKRENLRKTQG